MVDIHCHILPAVDDGAQNVQDSIEMAKAAQAQGLKTIIATPHHMNKYDTNLGSTVREKVEQLNQVLQQEKIDIKILAGQEVRIHGELIKGIEKGEVLPLGGSKFVLIEFPSNEVPRYTQKLFFDLQLEGYIPVIAHPERNQEIIEKPDVLYELINNGALSQVTTKSVVGGFGKKIQKFTMQLIEANLTHFIASDAHNTTNRGFMVEDAYYMVGSSYGNDMVYLFKENVELLVTGKNPMKEIPSKIKQKKFLGLF